MIKHTFESLIPIIYCVVPRTFRLYEELEKAEHAQLSDQSVSYGLDEGRYNLKLRKRINELLGCSPIMIKSLNQTFVRINGKHFC